VYAASSCADCKLRANCTKAAQGRRIKRYPEDEARDALRIVMQHPQARRIFSRRKAIVEPVFSGLRCQQGLDRFRRRGLKAVRREFALHVMAYNLSRAVALLRALFFYFDVVLHSLDQVAYCFLTASRKLFSACTANHHLAQPCCCHPAETFCDTLYRPKHNKLKGHSAAPSVARRLPDRSRSCRP
jgi:Transposase DDE domain